jgi:hypothetical protein
LSGVIICPAKDSGYKANSIASGNHTFDGMEVNRWMNNRFRAIALQWDTGIE